MACEGRNGGWDDPNSRHYAPNIAKAVRSNIYFVGIVNSNGEFYGQAKQTTNEIALDYSVYNDDNPDDVRYTESVMFEETLHLMNNRHFQVYSALFSAGYLSLDQIIERREYTSKNEGNFIPDQFQKYFEDGKLKEEMRDEFTKEYYNYGKTITGQSK